MALLDKEGIIPDHLIEAEERESDEKVETVKEDAWNKARIAYEKDKYGDGPKLAVIPDSFNYKGFTYNTGKDNLTGTAQFNKRRNERRYFYTDPKDSAKRASEGAWHLYKEDEDVQQDGFTGTYQYQSGRQGRTREQADRQQQVLAA